MSDAPCVSKLSLGELPEAVFPGRLPRDELRIVIRPGAHAAVKAHAKGSLEAEVCGVLLGRMARDAQGPFLTVEDIIEGQAAQSAPARVTFTPESWEHIFKEQERRDPGLKMVGWYHTHPRFGIFLSSHDRFIHQHFFAVEPWMVAYVVDPVRDEEGFFFWHKGRVQRAARFWIGDAPRACDGAELEGQVIEDDAAPPPPSVGAGRAVALPPAPAGPADPPWQRDPLILGLLGALAVGLFAWLGWSILFPDPSTARLRDDLLEVKLWQGALNAELRALRKDLRLPPSDSPELDLLDRRFQAILEELRREADRANRYREQSGSPNPYPPADGPSPSTQPRPPGDAPPAPPPGDAPPAPLGPAAPEGRSG